MLKISTTKLLVTILLTTILTNFRGLSLNGYSIFNLYKLFVLINDVSWLSRYNGNFAVILSAKFIIHFLRKKHSQEKAPRNVVCGTYCKCGSSFDITVEVNTSVVRVVRRVQNIFSAYIPEKPLPEVPRTAARQQQEAFSRAALLMQPVSWPDSSALCSPGICYFTLLPITTTVKVIYLLFFKS